MESSTETVADLEQSEPWIMLEDSDIEVCEEPLKTKEVEVPNNEELKQPEEDDFAKLRNHRKFIKQLETIEDLTCDPTDIAASDKTKVVEETTESKALCAKRSLCSVLLNIGGSTKLASYLCNTFLTLCVLALASGLAYYLQFDQFKTTNMKNILVRYTQPEYAMRYDKYIQPKYEKNKNHGNYDKYEDTTRKLEKNVRKENKHRNHHEQSGQNDYKKRKDRKEIKEYKNEFNEKRYNKKGFDKKVYKQGFKELDQKKNYKSKGDYKKKNAAVK